MYLLLDVFGAAREAARILIEAGANTRTFNKDGLSALELANTSTACNAAPKIESVLLVALP